ncbi:MAG: zf-HC2 domain-containing protein [candidate division WOR-3 bacterium]|nr:zf-HC2 domain-containing protein [candidate division WOR-3 bacterium]
MSTDSFREKLVRYLDGDLDDAERSELEKHLKKCHGCCKELQALKATLVLTSADAPPRFSGIEWKTFAPRRVRWWRWVWVPAAAAAVLLAIIFGGDAVLKHEVKVQENWVVVEGDSLSADEGMELALLLVAADDELMQGLESYEETISADVYSEIDELTEEEEAAFMGLLEEKLQEMERS